MSAFDSWDSYRRFARRLARESRYLRTPEEDRFLRELLTTATTRIVDLSAGLGLWRAQRGHGWRPLCIDGEHVDDIPAAHPPERMKPVPGRAKEGRANPKGIPVLYLSTRGQTAMSEVRPWLGSLVSLAHFRTTRPFRVVDLSIPDADTGRLRIHFSEPDPEEREQAVWTQLGRAFSEPTTSADDTADYAPTQLIAELFKNDGYDGIAYSSAFGENGHNIVLFDLDAAELASCTLHEVKSLEFNFKQTDNPYWIQDDGTMVTLSIDAFRPAKPPPPPDAS